MNIEELFDSEGNINTKTEFQSELDQIGRCAYLVGLADNMLSEEEATEFMKLNGLIKETLRLRKSIEHYESTLDFDRAIALKEDSEVRFKIRSRPSWRVGIQA